MILRHKRIDDGRIDGTRLRQMLIHLVIVALAGVDKRQVKMRGRYALRVLLDGHLVKLLCPFRIETVFRQAAEVITGHVLHAELVECVPGARRSLTMRLEQRAIPMERTLSHPEFIEMEESLSHTEPGIEILGLDEDGFHGIFLFRFPILPQRSLPGEMEKRHDPEVDVKIVFDGRVFEHLFKTLDRFIDTAGRQVCRTDVMMGRGVGRVFIEVKAGQVFVADGAAVFSVVLVAIPVMPDGDIRDKAPFRRHCIGRDVFVDSLVVSDRLPVAQQPRQVVRRVTIFVFVGKRFVGLRIVAGKEISEQDGYLIDIRIFDIAKDLFFILGLEFFIRIHNEKPVAGSEIHRVIARISEVVVPLKEPVHAPELFRNRHGVILASGIDDHDLVCDILQALQGSAEHPFFIFHNHADAQLLGAHEGQTEIFPHRIPDVLRAADLRLRAFRRFEHGCRSLSLLRSFL